MGARPEFWEHQLIPLATSTVALILIAWGIFLALVVGGLAVLVRRGNGEWPTVRADEWLRERDRHSRGDRRRASDRRRGSDRRSGRGDRRVGLPDLRGGTPERRHGQADRRSGRDRRSGVDRRAAVRLQAG